MKILEEGITAFLPHPPTTEVTCSSFPFYYTENQKTHLHEAAQKLPLKYLITAQKRLIYSSFQYIKALYLTPGPSCEPLNCISEHFFLSISKWEKLYKQFRLHNEEVLIHSNSKHSRQAHFVHRNRISFRIAGLMKRITELEGQEAFSSRQVFTPKENTTYREHNTSFKWHSLYVLLNNQLYRVSELKAI